MKQKVEVHPFPAFIPTNAKILLLGSFPGKEQTQQNPPDMENQWFYGAKRNQLWKILSSVYNTELITKNAKQALFAHHGIAVTDIFSKVIRINNSNLDKNLQIEEYNTAAIENILHHNAIEKVYFTSRYVESEFKKMFPCITNTEYLPSPSPRYAMKLEEKVAIYKAKLPK